MGKNWEYARMTEEAAAAGGPNVWVENIKENAYDKGVSDTRNKLTIPLLLGGALIFKVSEVAVKKIKKCVSDKKERKLLVEQKALEAEELLKENCISEMSTSDIGMV